MLANTLEGSITMGYERIGAILRFMWVDTGKGLAEENIPHVFERFAKFDSFVQGTGLGLSICEVHHTVFGWQDRCGFGVR